MSEKIILNSKHLGDSGITLLVNKNNKNMIEIYLNDEKEPKGSLWWEYQGSCINLRRYGEKEIDGSIIVKNETASLLLEK